MTSVTHAFVSTLSDDSVAAGAGEVLPSEWNAQHVLTGIRTILTANQNYYVAIGGSDSANGLTPATAFATLQHAMNFIANNLDIAGFTITVNIGSGSFAGFGTNSCVGGGIINFVGAGPSNTKITAGPNDGIFNFGECFDYFVISFPVIISLDQVTFQPGPPANIAIAVYSGGNGVSLGNPITFGGLNIAFSAVHSGTILFLMTTNGTIIIVPGTVTVGAGTYFQAYDLNGGALLNNNATWTLNGTPTFTSPFAKIIGISLLLDGGSYSGAATGTRFQIETGATVVAASGNPGALGPTFYPGSIAGTCDSGSVYDGFLGSGLGNITTGSYPQPTTTLRTVLTANTNFYVATTGSDSNSGSSTSPWATLTHAIVFIAENIDGGGFNVTVNVGAGSFAGFGMRTLTGVSNFAVAGASIATTSLTAGPNDGVFNLGNVISSFFNPVATIFVYNVTLDATVGSPANFVIWLGSASYTQLNMTDLTFVKGFNMKLAAGQQGARVAGGCFFGDAEGGGPGVTLSGNAANYIFAIDAINCQIGEAYTISGAPTYSDAFIHASAGGALQIYGTFSGAASGKRFIVDGNSVINTAGAGLTYLPGNVAGTVSNGGVYE